MHASEFCLQVYISKVEGSLQRKMAEIPKEDIVMQQEESEPSNKVQECSEGTPENKSGEKKEAKSKKRLSLFRKSKKTIKLENAAEEEPTVDQAETSQTNGATIEDIDIEDNKIVVEENNETVIEEKLQSRLSIFRKSKKEKSKKSDITEVVVKEGTKEGDNETAEVAENTEQVPEVKQEKKHKMLWKRKSNKNIKKEEIAETVETTTEHSTEIPIIEVADECDEIKPEEEEAKEELFETVNDKIVNIDEDVVDNTEAVKQEKVIKPKRKSLVQRLKSLNKPSKSTNTNEEETELENTEVEELNDSFHGVYAGQDKKTKKNNDEETNAIENETDVIDTVNQISDNTPVTDNNELVCPTETTTEEHNDSNESNLTMVTAIPDVLDDVQTNVIDKDDTYQVVDNTNEIVHETGEIAHEMDEIAHETVEIAQETGEHSKETADQTLNIKSEDPLEITSEDGEQNEITKNTAITDPKKCLDYVFVGHLNEKQKDESFVLAKKAINVYKNAQISGAYCQSCCNVM